MTFLTADRSRPQLERLTRLLIAAFPGSTIYQHTDLLRIPHDVLSNKVDAILLDAEMHKTHSLDLLQQLRRQRPDLPVFIISNSTARREQAASIGADGFFVLPSGKEQLLNTIRTLVNRTAS